MAAPGRGGEWEAALPEDLGERAAGRRGPLRAVADAAARGVGRVVLPVTAFMSDAPPSAGATQHARTFGGLDAAELEERLAAFGATVIARTGQ